jgi:uncharacterized protein YbjT (DUF2867 family)
MCYQARVLLLTGPGGNVDAELPAPLQRSPIGPYRIGCRHPDAVTAAEAVTLDFFDRSTWEDALAGITTLFLLIPLPTNSAARDAIVPFLQAVERAGCRQVVYISVFGADRVRYLPHYTVEKNSRTVR